VCKLLVKTYSVVKFPTQTQLNSPEFLWADKSSKQKWAQYQTEEDGK